MIPTIAQQLSSVRNTIAKTIIPALGEDEIFAKEQAQLILAILDWTLDVHEDEHLYEKVEHAEYRELLSQLLALTHPEDLAANGLAVHSETSVCPPTLSETREQVKRLKDASTTLARSVVNAEGQVQAKRLLVEIAHKQAERELAWCRQTGFPHWTGGKVTAVLLDSRSE